jgi:Family of unknown function (DUF695)/Regulator of ribonuclease activity B
LISVEVRHPTEDGFPDKDEHRSLTGVANRIADSAGDRAVMVGTVTGNGERRYLFYAKDFDWLSAWQATEKSRGDDRRFGVKVKADPDWGYYKGILPDAERADADRRTLERLARDGAHLDEPRVIDWFFLFPEAELARGGERVLLDHDYRVRVEAPTESGDWLVVASLTEVTSPRYIAQMSGMLNQFAVDQGGIYDGWGAEIAP